MKLNETDEAESMNSKHGNKPIASLHPAGACMPGNATGMP